MVEEVRQNVRMEGYDDAESSFWYVEASLAVVVLAAMSIKRESVTCRKKKRGYLLLRAGSRTPAAIMTAA